MENDSSNNNHIMAWGSYLARGVQQKSSRYAQASSRVVELVENYFESEGVSTFSSKMAVAFLQVYRIFFFYV
jgi:hypothetical protein